MAAKNSANFYYAKKYLQINCKNCDNLFKIFDIISKIAEIGISRHFTVMFQTLNYALKK